MAPGPCRGKQCRGRSFGETCGTAGCSLSFLAFGSSSSFCTGKSRTSARSEGCGPWLPWVPIGVFRGAQRWRKKMRGTWWGFLFLAKSYKFHTFLILFLQETCSRKSGIVRCAPAIPYYSPSRSSAKLCSVPRAATRRARGVPFRRDFLNPGLSVRLAQRPTKFWRIGPIPKRTGAGLTAAIVEAPPVSWPFRLADLKRDRHGKHFGRVRHILFLAI